MAKDKKDKKNKNTEKTLKSQGTSDLSQATAKLTKYYEENDLDPSKDWSKDKKHGETVSKLKKKIKIAKMKVEAGLSDEKADKKPNVKPEKVRTVKSQPASYDYPDVDGKPMTPDLKKRYRSKMRAILKAQMDPKEAQKKALASVMGTADTKYKKAKEESLDAPKKATKKDTTEASKVEKKAKSKDKKAPKTSPSESKKVKKQVKEED